MAAVGEWGASEPEGAHTPAPTSHHPCSHSPSRQRALPQVGWMGHEAHTAPAWEGFTQFLPPLSQVGNAHILCLFFQDL